MPTIGWIDALRTYNAGMPSWCVPRKGTPGYERVMRIRQGEQTKGFKEVLEDLERKTAGKPKKEKTSMAIDLGTQSANVPTISEGSPKTEVSTKKSSGSNNKMSDIYFSQEKSDGHFLLWKVKGDEVIQLADVYLTKTPDHPGGFVKSAGRIRKLHRHMIGKTEYLSYLTPPPHNNSVDLSPLHKLPSSRLSYSRPWVQREVIKGLRSLGYADDVVFDETPTKAEVEAEPEPLDGEGVEHRKAPPKPKRVDTPEVVKLLAELEKAKQEEKDFTAKWIAGGRKGSSRGLEFMERINGLEKEIRKARSAQTRAAKKA